MLDLDIGIQNFMDPELLLYCRELGYNLWTEGRYFKDLLLGKIRYVFQPFWSTTWTGDQITEHIWISDIASAFNKEKLKELGITHVFSTVLGVEPIFPDEFEYMNIPAQDISSQDLQQYFENGAAWMEEAINNGGKILVHCACGISRSASMVIAYLMQSTGRSYDETLAYVQSKRPIIQPNRGFEEQLRVWERRTRRDDWVSNF